jgi:hypothetical protein
VARLIHIPNNGVQGVFFLLHLHHHFLEDSHSNWDGWNLNADLICISLMAKDVELSHVFIDHLYFFI